MITLNIADAKTGNIRSLQVVYAYEFNREAIRTKNPNETLICIVVQDPERNALIEYYWKHQEPNNVVWHGYFFSGKKFEKLLQATPEGATFQYQKPQYLWRKLTSQEVAQLCNNCYTEII